jgi:hypothetical protein
MVSRSSLSKSSNFFLDGSALISIFGYVGPNVFVSFRGVHHLEHDVIHADDGGFSLTPALSLRRGPG